MGRIGYVIIAPVTNASTQVLPFNANRRSILFPATQGDVITYSPQSPVVAGIGFVSQAGQHILSLTYEQHGDIVCRPWFAINGAGPVSIPIVCSDAEPSDVTRPVPSWTH